MNTELKLIKPNIFYQASYLIYIKELGSEERYPFPLDFDYTNFPAMLNKIQQLELGANLPDGYVPSSTYWLVENDKIIGVSNLRHHLNESLEQIGGHIGLGIRPSFRGNKLSIQLLKLTLDKAKAIGIDEVHVHCYANNPASARMIVACGGVLESEEVTDTHIVQRYIV